MKKKNILEKVAAWGAVARILAPLAIGGLASLAGKLVEKQKSRSIGQTAPSPGISSVNSTSTFN